MTPIETLQGMLAFILAMGGVVLAFLLGAILIRSILNLFVPLP